MTGGEKDGQRGRQEALENTQRMTGGVGDSLEI